MGLRTPSVDDDAEPYLVHQKVYLRQQPPSDAPWQVRLNGNDSTIEQFDTKKQAVARAKELADNNRRPGVIVYDSNDQYQKFIPSDEYWGPRASVPAP